MTRYQVVPVDDNLMPDDEIVVLETDDFGEAVEHADGCFPGGAIIDTETGMIDVGYGWVARCDLKQQIADNAPRIDD